jgi:uroporphyrinogen decarboxylase
MNCYQRIEAALAGRRPDRVPVMLHNFPMAAREAGVSMREFREQPEAAARVFIDAVERYDYDGIVVDIDTATLAGAVGVPVDLPEDEPARCHGGILPTLEAVDDLPPPSIDGDARVRHWLEVARLLVARFGRTRWIRGNCDQCPFALASMMRTPQLWLMDLTDPDHEERVHRLLEFCTAVTCRFLELMAETGVHMLSNGDSPAGPDMISPRMYRQFALPYEQRVSARARELKLPYLLHICGDTAPILDDMTASGADCLELDYKTDVELVRENLGRRGVALAGNIDPSGVLAAGTPELVRQKTAELLERFADQPRFILNAGCAIPAGTPGENLRAMIQTAQSFERAA